MAYNPDKHHRRSIRLQAWDYRWPGAYFITVCTYRRVPLFGDVVGGQMALNPFGRIVADEWRRTKRVRDNVALDAFVAMPDHMHGVIVITTDPDNGDSNRGRGSSPMNPYGHPNRTFGGAMAGSLSTIMRQFKSMVTKRINRMRGTPGSPVWQRNYWERIIRDMDEMNAVRRYIADNPARWDHDRSHSAGHRM